MATAYRPRTLAPRKLAGWLATLAAALSTLPAVAAPVGPAKDEIRLVKQAGALMMPWLVIAKSGQPFDVRLQSDPGATDLAVSAMASNGLVDIVAGDFNADGLQDLALLNRARNSDFTPVWTSMRIAFANADGTVRMSSTPIGQFANYLAQGYGEPVAGDFNGDGRLDIALIDFEGQPAEFRDTVPMLLSRSDGTFADVIWHVGGSNPFFRYPAARIVPGEFIPSTDGVRRTDVALLRECGQPTIPLLHSQSSGVGVVHAPAQYFEAYCPDGGTQLVTGDFNGDGLTDLAKFSGGALIVATAGAGVFTVVSVTGGTFAQRAPNSKIVTGRFDEGPTTDIALIDRTGIAVAFGDSNAQFTVREHLSPTFAAWAFAPGATPYVGDFDGNGQDDIALIQRYPGTDWTTVPIAYSHTDRLPGGRRAWRQAVENQVAPGFVDQARATATRVFVGKFGQ
ncbi:VCBS repeat-containing protein [Piscinibacter sp. XHJ-5]|uniref:FG-GAP repeat domain-containing protein n=1 Tax=Piscinibacter sp. XHJ-5 TaxID=3037797 RepID=UPI002452E143|nr:VCBS repeat-containing protein [Piscinibacter sp. XHJ-5]